MFQIVAVALRVISSRRIDFVGCAARNCLANVVIVRMFNDVDYNRSPPNKSLDASGVRGLRYRNWLGAAKVLIRAAASTQPFDACVDTAAESRNRVISLAIVPPDTPRPGLWCRKDSSCLVN